MGGAPALACTRAGASRFFALQPASPGEAHIKLSVRTNPQQLSKPHNKAVSHFDWMTCGPQSTTSMKCHCVTAR